MRLLNIVTTAFLMTFFAAGTALSQTFISGPQSGVLPSDTYIVIGDISVQNGQSLVIEAGAEFYFDGPYDFTIDGELTAVGTEQDSIKFLPNAGVQSWDGIEFSVSASPSSQLDYCVISGSNSSGLETTSAQLTIEHSRFSDNSANYGGGLYASGTDLMLNFCEFSENSAITGAGLYGEDGASTDVNGGDFLYNLAEQHGGGIYLQNATGEITEAYFEGNRAENTTRGKGGAVSTQDAPVTVENCTFTLNYAGLSGGAVGLVSSSGSVVRRCVCYENSTPNQGGAIMLKWTNGLVENCTLDDNATVNTGGAIHISRDSFLDLKNTAVTNNSGASAVFVGSTSSTAISYNDFFGNTGDDVAGNIPGGTGQITTVNANGDPSDQYYNIFLDPEYANPALRDYHLTATSPCIDAGDPTSPLDPDATVADIGAFYFDQGSPGLSVVITPQNPPVQIPAGGGSFLYDISIQNTGTSVLTFDGWIMIILPDSSTFGPVILREGLSLPAGGLIERTDLSQSIPAGAPAGQYSFVLYAGTYPDIVIASDGLPFEKLAGAGIAGTALNWESDGLDVSDHVLLSAYPNPFNPSTALSFTLPETADIDLAVFNASGRRIVTVAMGWHNAGVHTVTFDASHLAAGIYFARFQAGAYLSTRKLLLLK